MPMRPSSSEVHMIRFESPPSSGSVAEPENVMGVPAT
ncbi:hypothetical protein MnTg01_01022 [archaeon MnTg01]|nr:hypothetical protein MnTg01_01022 [archaeon MnTg01]